MADTFTDNYGLTKPEPGTSGWDAKLNGVIDALDQIIHGWGWEPQGVAGVVQALTTTINVTGNVLADHPNNKRIKTVGETSGVNYGIINGGSYGGGITTLLVVLDSGSLTAGENVTLYKTVMPDAGSALPHGLHRASEGAASGYVLEWSGSRFIPAAKRQLAGVFTPGTTTTNLNDGYSSGLVAIDATGINKTVVLPPIASVAPGWGVVVMKTDASAFTVTVDGDGAETINGAATYVLTARYSTVTVVSDGSEWKIIASRL